MIWCSEILHVVVNMCWFYKFHCIESNTSNSNSCNSITVAYLPAIYLGTLTTGYSGYNYWFYSKCRCYCCKVTNTSKRPNEKKAAVIVLLLNVYIDLVWILSWHRAPCVQLVCVSCCSTFFFLLEVQSFIWDFVWWVEVFLIIMMRWFISSNFHPPSSKCSTFSWDS